MEFKGSNLRGQFKGSEGVRALSVQFALNQEIELFSDGDYFAADVKQTQTMLRIIEKNHTAIVKALAVDSTRT